jgi:predicted enzyme related to lactoylglutathione lyase
MFGKRAGWGLGCLNFHTVGFGVGGITEKSMDDIKKSLKSLVDAGAKTIQEIKDVGGGGLIASVKDTDGNIIGLIL